MEHPPVSMWQWVGAIAVFFVPIIAGAVVGHGLGKMMERSQRKDGW